MNARAKELWDDFCPEGKEVCTVKRKDVEWVLRRDMLLNKLLEHAAAQYQKCGGRNL